MHIKPKSLNLFKKIISKSFKKKKNTYAKLYIFSSPEAVKGNNGRIGMMQS